MTDSDKSHKSGDTTAGSSFDVERRTPVAGGPPGASSDIPYQVGKYRITKWLGSGGMGEVWLAEDEFGNEVAIKFFTASGPSRESFLKMFMREAYTLSMLQHRNICRTYGVEELGGRPYIIMEYVQGVDLATLITYLADTSVGGSHHEQARSATDLRAIIGEVEERLKHPSAHTAPREAAGTSTAAVRTLPMQQALSIVIKLCDAVQYAHERGVFHRDIKPSNIIIRRDGEPVLLDFGVAKLTGAAHYETFTLTGQFLGTIDYMAPEQELSSKHVDERADVYSIGAVLYEMLTGHKYFVSSGNILQDVEKIKDYRPIKPRAHSRHIDRDLQAIMLKAVEPDKEQRYSSARRLAQDLLRYQEGQPIQAKPPTIVYLMSKFVRRNALGVALSSVILLLLLAVGGYYAIDYYRHWGNWVAAFKHDFVGTREAGDFFEFRDSLGLTTAPWRVDSVGLTVSPHHWCWINNVRVSGNVRAVVRLHFDDMPDGFEIAINSTGDSVAQWYNVPRGYSCQVGGYLGTLDFVSVNKTAGVARTVNPVPSLFDRTRDVVVVFQREGERVTLLVNGRRQTEERDISPFSGPDFSRIGFRTYATSVHVRSIDVYRMSLPQKASPLIAGEALASGGHTREAVRTYLSIADDYPGTALAERALLRSMNTIYALEEPFKSHLVDSVTAMFGEDLQRTPSWQLVREMQLYDLWKSGRFDAVLRELPEHFATYPATRMALELQQMGARVDPPDSVRLKLVEWAARTQGISCLNARGMSQAVMERLRGVSLGYLNCGQGTISDLTPLASAKLNWLLISTNLVSDLAPLRNQPLAYLDCSSNHIASLDALGGAPLRTLSANVNHISDIGPLRYCPLEYVSLNGNLIDDLSPLRDKRIEYLFANDNRISDLGPVAGMPLGILECSNNGITSLAPLAGGNLRVLRCAWNRVGTLSPLSGARLQSLDVTANGIGDLQPLTGMPLRELACGRNRIGSLEPLMGAPLRVLNCGGNAIRLLAPLRGSPLEYLDCSNNPIADLSPVLGLGLRSLNCSGLRGVRLSQVRELTRLRELVCGDAGIDNLWPLTGMRLVALEFPTSHVSDLTPLAAMPLERLNCNANAVASLEPLRQAPLTTVLCADNQIESLAPLAGKALLLLDCQGNRLSTLEPFVANPPGNFWFFSESLPLRELDRVARAWDQTAATRVHATDARLLMYVKMRRYERLRELATVGPAGRAYLLVNWRKTRADALTLCAKAGGRLLTLAAGDAEFFARDSLRLAFRAVLWAGVTEAKGPVAWAVGDSTQPPAFPVVFDAEGEWIFQGTSVRKVAGIGKAAFIIEWEK
jgi:serine/threonine protein kinase/Leucine-rich repeat (LRR) protein